MLDKKAIIKEIRKLLRDIHYGLSPDSDEYIESISLKTHNDDNLITLKSAKEVLDTIMSGKISIENIDLENFLIQFSDKLFEDISSEYVKMNSCLSADK